MWKLATAKRVLSTIFQYSGPLTTITRGTLAPRNSFEIIWNPLVSFEDLRGKTIAEIGCGNGRFLKIFSCYAEWVYGIEPGDGVKNARTWNAGEDAVTVIRGDVYHLPPLPLLDHVFCLGVLHQSARSSRGASAYARDSQAWGAIDNLGLRPRRQQVVSCNFWKLPSPNLPNASPRTTLDGDRAGTSPPRLHRGMPFDSASDAPVC